MGQRADHAEHDGKWRTAFDRVGGAEQDGRLLDLVGDAGATGALGIIVAGGIFHDRGEQPTIETGLRDILRIHDTVHDMQVGQGILQAG